MAGDELDAYLPELDRRAVPASHHLDNLWPLVRRAVPLRRAEQGEVIGFADKMEKAPSAENRTGLRYEYWSFQHRNG